VRLLRVGRRCGWVEQGGTVYVARLPEGPPLVLDGSGAVVWTALLDGGTLDDVVARVAEATGESAPVVAAGVEGFVEGLLAAGVLEATTAAADDR
jgi:hypothetical protein